MDINIKLSIADWNIVMNALAQRTYGEVATIVESIKTQAQPQLAAVEAEQSDTSAE